MFWIDGGVGFYVFFVVVVFVMVGILCCVV